MMNKNSENPKVGKAFQIRLFYLNLSLQAFTQDMIELLKDQAVINKEK